MPMIPYCLHLLNQEEMLPGFMARKRLLNDEFSEMLVVQFKT